jgi:hypothetical protein
MKSTIAYRKTLIKSIVHRQARQYKYMKYLFDYPKIIEYIVNDNIKHTNIPIRYLEPFIIEHVG